MARVRLLKVLVQPVFALDDGENLDPMPEHRVVEIPASEWPTYSSERFPREMVQMQRDLDGDTPGPPDGE